MSSGLTTVFSRENTGNQELIGPFFLGIISNYFLWGIQITQSYYYYKSYRSTDRTWLKGAVGLLFIVDIIQSIAASQVAWRFMVDGWGDLNGVSLFPGWGLDMISITDSVTASIVHVFYAQKILTLLDSPHNYIWTIIVVSLSCTQLAGGIGCAALMISIKITLPELTRIKTWACIWLVTAAVTDIVITILMTRKLAMSRTGYKKTDDIISKLIRAIVETGLATAVVQFADIVIYLIWPLKPYHIVLGLTAPKVYSNSMLALLNSRKSRKSGQFKSGDSIQIHTSRAIVVTNDYELDQRKAGDKGLRPQSELYDRSTPDGESLTAPGSDHKESV